MDRHAKKRACQRDGGSEAGSEAGSNNSDDDIDMKDVRGDMFGFQSMLESYTNFVYFVLVLSLLLVLSIFSIY